MKTIILYGDLRKKFGKEFRLNVASPGAAIKALCALIKGFEKYLIDNSEPGFYVKSGKEYLDKDALHNPTGKEVIRISPYIVGSKKAFKAIVGIALIAAAFYTAGGSLAAMTAFQSSVLSFGVSLVLGGISEMLFTPPKPPEASAREEAKPSYSFDGPVNTTQQGNAVPLCYGQILAGSQAISAVIIAKDI